MKTHLASIAASACAIFAASQLPLPAHAAPQADFARGATLFQQRCAMCHSVNGKGGKLGPDLTRVVGRKAGSAAFNYSPAMKASKTIWTASTLDAYLAAPTTAVPGSRMVITVTKADERKAIVAYLATSK